jgi:hypothetical protein
VLVRPSLDLDRPKPYKSHIHHVPPVPAASAHAEGRVRLLPDNLVFRRKIQHREIYAPELGHLA